MNFKNKFKLKKIIIAAICCTSASMLLAGCGSSNNSDGGNGDNTKVTVKASVIVTGTNQRLNLVKGSTAGQDQVTVDLHLKDSTIGKDVDLGEKTATIGDEISISSSSIAYTNDDYKFSIESTKAGDYSCSLPQTAPSFKLNKTSGYSGKLNYNCSKTIGPDPSPFGPGIHLPSDVQTYADGRYRGVNLAGADFYNGSFSNTDDKYHFVPYAQDGSFFFYEGANTVRIPILWEYLLGPKWVSGQSYQSIDTTSTYWAHIKDLLTKLAQIKGLHIILDMHDYMRFDYQKVSDSYNGNSVNIIGSDDNRLPSTADYAAIWKSIDGNVRGLDKKNQISFELMNEPYFVSTTSATTNSEFDNLVATNYEAAIKAISSKDPKRKLIVDGSHWSGLHSWSKDIGGNSGGSKDPINILIKKIGQDKISGFKFSNLIVDVHQYFNQKKGDTIPEFSGHYTSQGCHDYSSDITKWVNDIDSWSKAHSNIKWMVGEVGIPQYDSNRSYLNKTCQADINELYTDARAKTSFQGFTLWKAGHAWGPATYMNIQPGAVKNDFNGEQGDAGELTKSYEPNDIMYSKNSSSITKNGDYYDNLGFKKLSDISWLPKDSDLEASQYYILNQSSHDLYATYPHTSTGGISHSFKTPYSTIIGKGQKLYVQKSILNSEPSNSNVTLAQFEVIGTHTDASGNKTPVTFDYGSGAGFDPKAGYNAANEYAFVYNSTVAKTVDPYPVSWKGSATGSRPLNTKPQLDTKCRGQQQFCADTSGGLFSTIIDNA